MRCGDMYQEDVLQRFHTCAISRHQCVPQRVEVPAAGAAIGAATTTTAATAIGQVRG